MPIVTVPFAPEGPVVEVMVGISLPRAEAMRLNGIPVPPPIPLRLLVDTGASDIVINRDVLIPLSLAATGQCISHTANGMTAPMDVFDTSITFPGARPVITFNVVPVMGSAQPYPGFHGLLGRRILNIGVMVYAPHLNSVLITF